MPAVTASVTLRIPGELLERVDRLVATSRNAWLLWVIEEAVKRGETEEKYSPSTRAVERALGASGPDPAQPASLSGSQAAPAPAEQPEQRSRDEAHWRPGSSEERLLGLNVRPAREFRPYPKGGGG